MWYIVGWSSSGLSASSSRIFYSLLLCSRTIFAFRRFKADSVLSLRPRLCNTLYMHSYKCFSSYSGPLDARLVHVGIVVVISFCRGGPTTLLGQDITLSAVVVVPIEFSTAPCMPSQLLHRCPFSIARVPSAILVGQFIFVDVRRGDQ